MNAKEFFERKYGDHHDDYGYFNKADMIELVEEYYQHKIEERYGRWAREL